MEHQIPFNQISSIPMKDSSKNEIFKTITPILTTEYPSAITSWKAAAKLKKQIFEAEILKPITPFYKFNHFAYKINTQIH